MWLFVYCMTEVWSSAVVFSACADSCARGSTFLEFLFYRVSFFFLFGAEHQTQVLTLKIVYHCVTSQGVLKFSRLL